MPKEGVINWPNCAKLKNFTFGKDVSTYNYKEDDYDINIRFNDAYRKLKFHFTTKSDVYEQ